MTNKWNKVLKADGTTYYWMSKKMAGDSGWGNGYVAIPANHPWARQSQFVYSSDLMSDSDGESIIGRKVIPYYDRNLTAGFHLVEENDQMRDYSWTYDKKHGFKKEMYGYYVIGFYANGGEFDSMSDVVSDTIKLMDDADLFFRDYNTLKKIKKKLFIHPSLKRGYDCCEFFFNDEIKRDVNNALKKHLGNQAGLF